MMRTCAEERLRSHGREFFRNRDINQLVQGNPSSSAVLRASSSRDGWSLSAKLLFFIIPPHLSQCFLWGHDSDTPRGANRLEITAVKGDQQVRFPRESHFSYHLVIGALQPVTRLSAGRISSGLRQPTLAADQTTTGNVYGPGRTKAMTTKPAASAASQSR
jgi:hypothetical protein